MARLVRFAAFAVWFTTAAVAQTADRSAAPPSAPLAAPMARTGTYSVQNGELIVAPGLRIPNGNVPWALDETGGRQVLVPIHHAPLQPAGSDAKIPGTSSRTPLHSSSPSFFVHTSDRTENSGDAGRGSPTGWALLKSSLDGDSRDLAHVKFADVNAATVCTAPVVCTAAEALPEGWIRITPRQPLEAGEYALVPVPRSATMATVVYDFSIGTQSADSKDAVAPGQNLDVAHKKKKH